MQGEQDSPWARGGEQVGKDRVLGTWKNTDDPGEHLQCFGHSSGSECSAWNNSLVHKTGTWCRNASSFYHRRKKGRDRL